MKTAYVLKVAVIKEIFGNVIFKISQKSVAEFCQAFWFTQEKVLPN